MDLGKLSREGLVEKIGKNPKLVGDAIAAAERDIDFAGGSLDRDLDWALAIAYDGLLQAGRALMFHYGFRPTGEHSHIAVVRFTAEAMPKESTVLVTLFNRLRTRRHDVVYHMRGTVTKPEAENAISLAKRFVSAVKSAINR